MDSIIDFINSINGVVFIEDINKNINNRNIEKEIIYFCKNIDDITNFIKEVYSDNNYKDYSVKQLNYIVSIITKFKEEILCSIDKELSIIINEYNNKIKEKDNKLKSKDDLEKFSKEELINIILSNKS